MKINNKYKLTGDIKTLEDGRNVFRIEALRDFGDVRKGDLGGFIESEDNLSINQSDNSWVGDNAIVAGSSKVSRDSRVLNETVIDESLITKNSIVSGMTNIKNSTISSGEVTNSNVDKAVITDSRIHSSNIQEFQASKSTVENSGCEKSILHKSSVIGGSFVSGSKLSNTDISENSSVINSKAKSFENVNGEVCRSLVSVQSIIEDSELLGNSVIRSFVKSSDLKELDKIIGREMEDNKTITSISSISLTDEDLSDLDCMGDNKNINR